MMVVADTQDIFVPLSEEAIFVKYSEHKEIINKLFDKLPQMFAGNKIGEAALGSALRIGEAALVLEFKYFFFFSHL